MDRVTIGRTGLSIDCQYAAPSVLSGRFVACVGDDQGLSPEQLREAFTDPGSITVHNIEEHYADKTYTNYTTVDEIRENEHDCIVLLS